MPEPTTAEELSFEEQADDIADIRPLDLLSFVVFFFLFIIVALQFFTRYVLNDSLGWTEEIARYFLILLGFTGGIICIRKNSHIALTFLYRHLPAVIGKGLTVLCHLATAAFFLYCGWLAIELAQRTGSNMASIELPKSIIYYIVSGSCLFMGVLSIQQLLIHRGNPPPEQH